VCEADPVLGAFEWSSFAVEPVAAPSAQISISITAYNDVACTNKSSSFLRAPNPLIFTDLACFPGPFFIGRLFYVKAVSCTSNSTFQLSTNSDKSCTSLGNLSVVSGYCNRVPELSFLASSDIWFVVSCTMLSSATSAPAQPCLYGSLCLPIPDFAFFIIAALLSAHLLQAVVWAVVAKRKVVFSAANFLIVVLVPVFGLVLWLRLCRKSQLHAREETLLEEIHHE
jgi:hypothetical protein